MGKLKIWAPQEDQILVRISNTIKSKKWKKASQELRHYGYQRTDVQCRQRYINHLDPCVNKELWSEQQLEILYSKYSQYGNKWFLLQKHLPGRTQTKIKNYFYGNIRYFLKIITKFFLKKSTGFINDIKTEILLDMYEAKNDFEGFTIIPRTIKRMRYKVEKNFCQKLIRENEDCFYQFTQHFLKNYTQKSLSRQAQSEKEELKFQESRQESPQVSEGPQEFQKDVIFKKVACEVDHPTKVVVINSVGGNIVSKRQEELEYLKKMAIKHYGLYEHYQRNYMSLLFSGEEK